MAQVAGKIRVLICLALLVTASQALAGEPIRIATAANFIRPMEKIATLFTKQSGIEVQVSYGSSGKLFAQISQGAPYDLFLSADMARPRHLQKDGLCLAPFLYATGQMVLWSAHQNKEIDTWQQALSKDRERISIANPATAPYGKVAAEALEKTGLLSSVQSRLVYGQSVGQAFQFAHTGGTGYGFVALSQALSDLGQKGQHWPVPEAEPVFQGGCLLTTSPRIPMVKLFIDFMASKDVQAIKSEFGYLP